MSVCFHKLLVFKGAIFGKVFTVGFYYYAGGPASGDSAARSDGDKLFQYLKVITSADWG